MHIPETDSNFDNHFSFMADIILLGAGRVGRAIASDLCKDYNLTVADINDEALSQLERQYSLNTVKADLADHNKLKELIAPFDLVVSAVPGFMGYQTLESIIEAGKDVADISFFEEDPFDLHQKALGNEVTAVIDCGVAPGMSNMILGYHNNQMGVQHFECMVGGLPIKRSWPYEYKAPFSPIDVIEEYIRPARLVIDGDVVIKPALSDAEYVEIDPIGTLEAFNTDGLRTLLQTMEVPNMKEKTLRYPGHIEYMKLLRESGFFDKKPKEIKGSKVRPIDLTAELLFEKWKLKPREEEFTIMDIIIEGIENQQYVEYTYHLYDRYDPEAALSSMARTTGFTCSAVARLLLEKQYQNPGINPPEYVGADEDCFKQILDDLEARNVVYMVDQKPSPAESK